MTIGLSPDLAKYAQKRTVKRTGIGDDCKHALLHTAFNQVCNPIDWKAPIDATVPWEVANIYKEAIEYMTGVECQCEQVGGDAHLVSVGYRMGPCGDH